MRAILMTSAVTGITYSGTIALNEKPISGFRAVAYVIEKLKKLYLSILVLDSLVPLYFFVRSNSYKYLALKIILIYELINELMKINIFASFESD